MKRLLAPVVGIGFMLAVMTPAEADNSWGSYHWGRSSNPVSLTIVDSMIGEWDSYFGPVVSDWDASAVLALSTSAGGDANKDRKTCKAILGKIRACNAGYGFNGWLGLAQIWIYSGTTHIAQGTVKVNDSYFNTSTYNKPAAKRHVLCQEVGHDFGLDHQYTQPSCMDDTNGLFDPAYQSPGSHDYDQLSTIYTSHLDSGASASSGGGPGNSGNHADTYVSQEDGFTVVTHIVWAR